MASIRQYDEQTLTSLDQAVVQAAAFFAEADELLADNHQTARDALAHLVFWHREYVAIAQALATGRQPTLKDGTFSALNAQACREFRTESLPALALCLVALQQQFAQALRCLPDWSIEFPVKQGGRFCSIKGRMPTIESHIRNHVARLRTAEQRARRKARAP